MSKEAMKRTVDKIKSTFWEGYVPEPVKPAQCKYPKCSYPCSDLPDCRDAQQALDKMAENAREIGLDYEPAQQEPVGEITAEDMGRPFNAIRINTHFYKEIPPVGTLLYTRPQAREWVGLTDEDKEFIAKRAAVYDWHDYEVIEASEAKLKEKNT